MYQQIIKKRLLKLGTKHYKISLSLFVNNTVYGSRFGVQYEFAKVTIGGTTWQIYTKT